MSGNKSSISSPVRRAARPAEITPAIVAIIAVTRRAWMPQDGAAGTAGPIRGKRPRLVPPPMRTVTDANGVAEPA